MIHGKMAQDGGYLSCHVGLLGGISGHLHVSLMDPIGVLPELQALILLVDETYFFTVVLLALA